MTKLRHTPLFHQHEKLGAKFVPFAGFEMPVQYEGVVPEHHATRQAAGIFDVSHMGEVFVVGPEAEQALDYLTCNDVSKLLDGKAHYSALINEAGGVIDDIIIYRFNKERFLVCVNASNATKDFEWMSSQNKFNAEVTDRSNDFGQIALQGPRALEIYAKLCGQQSIFELPYFHFREDRLLNCSVIVARTGYTGEDGLELFIPAGSTAEIWDALMKAGAAAGLKACGLGARDSLRLEACYPLHGHEMADDISAIESGLGWIVKQNKASDFIGRQPLTVQKQQGAPRRLCGFFVTGKGIVRHGDQIFSSSGEMIGVVTSGTKTPTVDRALGLALLKSEYVEIGREFETEVRGRRVTCEIVKTPFYKRNA